VLDFFAGSGTMGAAAAKNGRSFLMIDQNPEAIAVMEKRLGITPEIVTPGIAAINHAGGKA
jgi:site-specific DNA-methyltransferase (adenine-specific)